MARAAIRFKAQLTKWRKGGTPIPPFLPLGKLLKSTSYLFGVAVGAAVGVVVFAVLPGFNLWVFITLVLCVFDTAAGAVAVVESAAKTGMAKANAIIDANKRLSDFFMVFLLRLRFTNTQR